MAMRESTCSFSHECPDTTTKQALHKPVHIESKYTYQLTNLLSLLSSCRKYANSEDRAQLDGSKQASGLQHYEDYFDRVLKSTNIASRICRDHPCAFPRQASTHNACTSTSSLKNHNTAAEFQSSNSSSDCASVEVLFAAPARQVKFYSIYLDIIANLNTEYQHKICEPDILAEAISNIAILGDQVNYLTRPSGEQQRIWDIVSAVRNSPVDFSTPDGEIIRAANIYIRAQRGEAQPYFAIATRAAILLCRPNGARTGLFAHHTLWLSDVVLRDNDGLSFTLLNSSLSIFEFITTKQGQKSQWLNYIATNGKTLSKHRHNHHHNDPPTSSIPSLDDALDMFAASSPQM